MNFALSQNRKSNTAICEDCMKKQCRTKSADTVFPLRTLFGRSSPSQQNSTRVQLARKRKIQTLSKEELRRVSTRLRRRQRNQRRFHQFEEIGKFHPHQLSVRTCVEGDFLVLGESFVSENVHPVKITEWRHRSRFAVRKPAPKFRFGCQLYRVNSE